MNVQMAEEIRPVKTGTIHNFIKSFGNFNGDNLLSGDYSTWGLVVFDVACI